MFARSVRCQRFKWLVFERTMFNGGFCFFSATTTRYFLWPLLARCTLTFWWQKFKQIKLAFKKENSNLRLKSLQMENCTSVQADTCFYWLRVQVQLKTFAVASPNTAEHGCFYKTRNTLRLPNRSTLPSDKGKWKLNHVQIFSNASLNGVGQWFYLWWITISLASIWWRDLKDAVLALSSSSSAFPWMNVI